jgi:protein-tyrosine phosphatase
MKILMVCLGNICRSPLAQGILEAQVKRNRLDWKIDSAGTSGWHAGEKPDGRAIAIAKQNSINISNQRSRMLKPEDFNQFDFILAMDQKNYSDILRVCPTPELASKVHLILEFAESNTVTEVPDPYYDGGFQRVFNLLNEACSGFISGMVSA